MSEAHVNFFSGNPLNRLSWLRTSHTFLNAIVSQPTTRWTLFKAGNPLVLSPPSSESNKVKPTIAKLPTKSIEALLGPKPYFGQAETPGTLVTIPEGEKHSPLEAARHLGPTVIFLGLDERAHDTNGALPTSDFSVSDPEKAVANLKGTAYFALDVAGIWLHEEVVNQVISDAQREEDLVGEGELTWAEPMIVISSSDRFDSAVFAMGRSLTDWNLRNQFCAGCGSPVYSMWGGWKISCTSLLPWNKDENIGRKICITANGLHNFTHPRTDPVVIMVTIDETGERALLGRSHRYKGMMYSALSGFVEPGESFEDAVIREIWEEAGVKVTNPQYHSSQPWPYPANLMTGYYARADSSQPIRTDLDNELADARWFTRQEVLAVITTSDPRGLAPNTTTFPASTSFFIPPVTAIGGVLIRDWAEGRVKFSQIQIQNTGQTQRGPEKL